MFTNIKMGVLALGRLPSIHFRTSVANVLCRHHRNLASQSGVKEIQVLKFLQKNKPDKVDFVDISLPGYDGSKYNGVSYEAAMEEMHVIDENNEVHRGVPAFAVMYAAVGLDFLGRLMMLSPVRPLMDKAYAVFARNRLKWTGRGEECTTRRCEKKTP
ncbi:uncharacterized protein LOC133554433 isoform X2 [Nerophis ophidion]|uniref:uncharacterized protein LOC133554328 isoform X2 n=1 Tax=Nerophis ophidion TaxID=159077 RepID=UPI002ADFFA0A|nr:uncharacterized protein LOC133554328 isoform X2 [Nerophis ophidion]XP_061759183.1 uncharacterized protein LOC133554433 isoform X2 [Nerophis ophidion]